MDAGGGIRTREPLRERVSKSDQHLSVLKPAAFDLAWLPPLLDLNFRWVNLIFQVKDFILDLLI